MNVMENGNVGGVLGDDGDVGIGVSALVTQGLDDGNDRVVDSVGDELSIRSMDLGVSPAPAGRARRVKEKADKRTYDDRREESARTIERVVMAVASAQGVAWQGLFMKTRGSNDVSLARVIAMAVCCELGVPLCHTARTFNRDWATVYTAEQRCGRRYRGSTAFREMWDGVLEVMRGEA